jgi:hypothetical protein
MPAITVSHWREAAAHHIPCETPASRRPIRRDAQRMRRKPLTAAALVLGLAAAPAFAQPSTAGAPEDSTAARTMEQNRRIPIAQPAPPGGQTPVQEAAATESAGRQAAPATGKRRVASAENPGAGPAR